MPLPESGSWETWKNGVASQHVANGVKGTRVINWSAANPYCHGNWMRWVLDLVLNQLGSNNVKTCTEKWKWGPCGVLGQIKIGNAKQSKVKYEVENFIILMVCIQIYIYIYLLCSGACIIVFMWYVAVRNMSGEESCEDISYGSRVGWWWVQVCPCVNFCVLLL